METCFCSCSAINKTSPFQLGRGWTYIRLKARTKSSHFSSWSSLGLKHNLGCRLSYFAYPLTSFSLPPTHSLLLFASSYVPPNPCLLLLSSYSLPPSACPLLRALSSCRRHTLSPCSSSRAGDPGGRGSRQPGSQPEEKVVSYWGSAIRGLFYGSVIEGLLIGVCLLFSFILFICSQCSRVDLSTLMQFCSSSWLCCGYEVISAKTVY